MKKLYFLFLMLGISSSSNAQTVTGGDMETWRTSTHAGAISPVSLEAPVGWRGVDSFIIAEGQLLGPLAGIPASAWKRQLFRESTNIHGGTYSAKLMTLRQDTLGNFPGYLTDANFSVPISISLTVGTPTYSGGQGVTQRVTSVSAWVEYLPGIDSVTGLMGGADTAILTVQARGHIHGADTTVGTGFVQILPSTGFTQVTANLTYFDTTYTIDTIRMVFASSGGGLTRPLDSSTLYVDDVTMAGVPNFDRSGVKNITAGEVVKVYPNPSNGAIYFDAAQAGLTFALYDVNGKLQATKAIKNNDAADVSSLPDGVYLYAVRNDAGVIVQKGKITLSR